MNAPLSIYGLAPGAGMQFDVRRLPALRSARLHERSRAPAQPARMSVPFDLDAERAALAAHLAGDPAAMKSLVDRLACVPRLVAACNVRAGHPLKDDELRDVTQDAFLAIVRKLPKLEPRAPLESWLHGVCVMQFRVALRNKRRRSLRQRELPDEAVDPRPDEVAHLQRATEAQAVLSRLGGVEADVIRMKHLDGLTFEELGAALAMSPNTVKAYYYRGMTALRRSLSLPAEPES